MDKKRVAVIFGGVSPEHEVSVITGLQALENLDKENLSEFLFMFQKTENFSPEKTFKNRNLPQFTGNFR